jgi:hypothetical protein
MSILRVKDVGITFLKIDGPPPPPGHEAVTEHQVLLGKELQEYVKCLKMFMEMKL